jgi:hypothetical protein
MQLRKNWKTKVFPWKIWELTTRFDATQKELKDEIRGAKWLVCAQMQLRKNWKQVYCDRRVGSSECGDATQKELKV